MSLANEALPSSDQFRIWGMDKNGNRYPAVQAFTDDWNSVRRMYLEQNPTVVCVSVTFTFPDRILERTHG